MKNLANNIKNEIILAGSVSDNYLRNFDIPFSLNGKKYQMEIDDDELVIKLYENEREIGNFLFILPTKIKGTFIEDINENTTKHCITKNNYDGIRISSNQASLDVNFSEIETDKEFDLFVSLNCVENVKSFQFTIKYDPLKLTLLRNETLIRKDNINLNPLFEDIAGKVIPFIFPHTDESIGRSSFGYIGSSCVTGSGNVAKLVFKVNEDVSGETEIKFDDTYYRDNLEIFDCNTNKFTLEDLPDSKENTKIEII